MTRLGPEDPHRQFLNILYECQIDRFSPDGTRLFLICGYLALNQTGFAESEVRNLSGDAALQAYQEVRRIFLPDEFEAA